MNALNLLNQTIPANGLLQAARSMPALWTRGLALGASLALLVVSVNTLAAKPNGAVIKRSQGSAAWVRKTPKGAWLPVQRGDWLPVGSELKTGKASALVLTFKNLEFRMGPQSRLKLRSLLERGSSRLHLSSGAAWFHLKKKSSRGQKLRVSTPTTLAAVRGTMFSLIEKKKTTYACVCHGEIETRLQGKGSQAKSVKTGQSLHVAHNNKKPALEDYKKYFTKRSVDPEFLKRPEAPAMQYCLSCHKLKQPGSDESDEFEDY